MLIDVDENSGKILSANQTSVLNMYGYSLQVFKLRLQDLDVIEPGVHANLRAAPGAWFWKPTTDVWVLHRKKDESLLPLEAVASVLNFLANVCSSHFARQPRAKTEEEIKTQYHRFIRKPCRRFAWCSLCLWFGREVCVWKRTDGRSLWMPQLLEGGHAHDSIVCIQKMVEGACMGKSIAPCSRWRSHRSHL